MPNTGFAGSLPSTSRSCSTVCRHISGFPGPLLTNNPSKSAWNNAFNIYVDFQLQTHMHTNISDHSSFYTLITHACHISEPLWHNVILTCAIPWYFYSLFLAIIKLMAVSKVNLGQPAISHSQSSSSTRWTWISQPFPLLSRPSPPGEPGLASHFPLSVLSSNCFRRQPLRTSSKLDAFPVSEPMVSERLSCLWTNGIRAVRNLNQHYVSHGQSPTGLMSTMDPWTHWSYRSSSSTGLLTEGVLVFSLQ